MNIFKLAEIFAVKYAQSTVLDLNDPAVKSKIDKAHQKYKGNLTETARLAAVLSSYMNAVVTASEPPVKDPSKYQALANSANAIFDMITNDAGTLTPENQVETTHNLVRQFILAGSYLGDEKIVVNVGGKKFPAAGIVNFFRQYQSTLQK